MRITIDLKIFLFALIFVITNQIEFYVILMVYAIIHELGHLLCGIILKLKAETFNITPFGLQISFSADLDLYNEKIKNGNKICIKRMILAIAGPLTNFVIVAILITLSKIGINTENIFLGETAVYANILIGIFNLIPIYPLDGGRILKEIINIRSGMKKSYYYINKISNITMICLMFISSILLLYIHNIAILIILAYLGYLVIKQNRIYKIKQRILYSLSLH
jgi:stage IV sporulation protein FB